MLKSENGDDSSLIGSHFSHYASLCDDNSKCKQMENLSKNFKFSSQSIVAPLNLTFKTLNTFGTDEYEYQHDKYPQLNDLPIKPDPPSVQRTPTLAYPRRKHCGLRTRGDISKLVLKNLNPEKSSLEAEGSTSNRKKFMCTVCDKGFTLRSSLVVHERQRHTGERPYKCTRCHQSFVKQSRLKKHMRVHDTGEATYVCEICGAPFSVRLTMKKHRTLCIQTLQQTHDFHNQTIPTLTSSTTKDGPIPYFYRSDANHSNEKKVFEKDLNNTGIPLTFNHKHSYNGISKCVMTDDASIQTPNVKLVAEKVMRSLARLASRL